MNDWIAIEITAPADRETVAQILFRNGYTVRQRKRREGNKTITYIEYRRGLNDQGGSSGMDQEFEARRQGYLRRRMGQRLSILTVEKVTPAGWVKTTDGRTFSQTLWIDSLSVRGGYGVIIPATEELMKKAAQQDAEREEENGKKRVIGKAQSLIEKERGKILDYTYERAVKIIEAFEEINKGELDCSTT